MRIGTPLLILIIIAFATVSITFLVNDINTYYPTSQNISTSNFADNYNYITEMNESTTKIGDALQNIGQEESGWKQFFGTLYVIPLAIITVIKQMFLSIPYIGSIFIAVTEDLGVPGEIVSIGILAITIGIIIMLIKFWHRPST
jgi:uncharacterized membrane protein